MLIPSNSLAILKHDIVSVVSFFFQKGWCPATSSNYSFREEGKENFFVSRSGIDKSEIFPNDFIEVDADLNIKQNTSFKVSAEGRIHSQIYQSFPDDVHCILHTHSIYNTILTKFLDDKKKEEITLLPITGYEIQKGFEGIKSHQETVIIPIFENSQDIDFLSLKIGNYLKYHPECKALLIAAHGLYTWGKDIKTAKKHVETAEFLFECLWKLEYQNKIK